MLPIHLESLAGACGFTEAKEDHLITGHPSKSTGISTFVNGVVIFLSAAAFDITVLILVLLTALCSFVVSNLFPLDFIWSNEKQLNIVQIFQCISHDSSAADSGENTSY